MIDFEEISKKGYKMSIVSIEHLQDLSAEADALSKSSMLGTDINHFLKGFYNFGKPDTLWESKSLITIATPSPQVKIFFGFKGNKLPVMIPPTYREFIETPKDLENSLNGILCKYNLHAMRAHNLPEKLLAVHSGLSEYGRNNISYIPGMGSFYLLSAFYSDVPCDDSTWKETVMMKACEKCSRCIEACPTNAIIPERFLINAERCLTYQNEFVTEDQFPNWISSSSHNCLLGCLHCQVNCPMNKAYLENIVELDEFTEEETNDILAKKPLDQLPEALVTKLEHLNLKNYYHILSRNLTVLLQP